MQGNEKVFNGFIKSFISEEEHKEKSALAKDILNTRYAKGVFKESHGIREDYDIDDFVKATYIDAKKLYPNWSKPMIENFVSDMLLKKLAKSNVLIYDRR